MSRKVAKDLVTGDDIYPYCEGYSNEEYKTARKKLKVRKSNIPGAGKGLFAKEKLKKHELLGIYSGKMLSKREHRAMSDADASYVITLDIVKVIEGKRQYIIVDGKDGGNMLAMLNDGPHSGGEANVDIDSIGMMYTIRPIKKDEELLWDYGTKYWGSTTSSESRSPTHSSERARAASAPAASRASAPAASRASAPEASAAASTQARAVTRKSSSSEISHLYTRSPGGTVRSPPSSPGVTHFGTRSPRGTVRSPGGTVIGDGLPF
jgi:hypothetical protein